MGLTLTIENFANLPDGGPLCYRVTGGRGFDIGRETYLDRTLPDPDMFFSSKHCEVRYRYGACCLYDVSLNGTLLDRTGSRLQESHRLRHRDPPRHRPIRLPCVPEHLTAQAVSVALFLRADFLWGTRGDAVPLAREGFAHRTNRPRAIAGAAAPSRRQDS